MNVNAVNAGLLAKYEGAPVDLAPWGYLWRRDRLRQERPEANFIPRRLERCDRVYRTLLPELGEELARPICYRQDDIMTPQLPAPAFPLLTGLLWEGGISDYSVELVFPAGGNLPSADGLEVRTYPTAWGWFGWTNDRLLNVREVSADGRTWILDPPAQTIDYAYNQRVKAQTELICVFAPEGVAVPEIRVTGGSLGTWKPLTFTVEWGLDGKYADAEPSFEGHVALLSAPVREGNRMTFSCLYSDVSRFGCDSRFTLILDRKEGDGATVLLRELAEKPVWVPEVGIYFCNAEAPVSLNDYLAGIAAKGEKNVRDKVRSHPEAKNWEEIFEKVRLWRCPEGTKAEPFPPAPAASAVFRVPDKRFETMYELAVEQLRGPHMWGMLAAEVARSALAMEMLGLRREADRVYQYFFDSPGVRADGDYVDPAGSFEWAKSMRHDLGYAHEGTHCSTGRLLFSMMYRYYLSGDREWLNAHLDRLKKAASFIIEETSSYAADFPEREKLRCFGMMPPSMLGDYALPACDWRWYACDNAFAQMGLSAFADVLRRAGDPEAEYYLTEAKRYEDALRAVLKEEALFAPVRRGRDGISRSYLPRMLYAGGLLLYGEETNVPQFALGINDLFQGSLPLAEIGGVLDANDRRMIGTIDAVEERGMEISRSVQARLEHPTANAQIREEEERLRREREEKGQSTLFEKELKREDRWFWTHFSNLPKISHNANIYLRQDDIPNFLHFFLNHAIVMVGTNGKMWEHEHPDIFVSCDNPDNGTAAWFTENFRNMLVTEDLGVLWLAKGTPRSWLEDGQEISVSDTPTFYGDIAYRITSHVSEGRIEALIDVPSRETPAVMKLRLRHPEAKKIASVSMGTVDPDGETVTLLRPSGKLKITAIY